MKLSNRSFLLCAIIAAMLGGAGCYEHTVKPGWQPPFGERHYSPTGFEFWFPGGTSLYPTAEKAGLEIDRIFTEWAAWYQATYGDEWIFSILPKVLPVTIQLFPFREIPGYYEDFVEVGIYWEIHKQIDVAMRARYHWDPAIGLYTQGIEVLKHEWTHVIRGPFHPYPLEE